MADDEVICANRECPVAQDGKCLEGYDLDKCPHYGRAPDDEDLPDDSLDEGAGAFEGIRLPDGLPLGSEGANRILGLLPSRMIGIIGVNDSGKTSMIAGLYDLFQVGPVGGTLFAGSSTLPGFERICHDARVTSERDEALSERTKRGEVRFYHIDVRHQDALISLLIADRSGEEYEEVADFAANASAMFELRRADTIAILVDGRRLSSPSDRADTIGAIPTIIQGMAENKAFARRPNLAVVLTKNDVVVASAKPDKVSDDFKAIVDGLRTRFAENFGEICSFVTAASPKDMNVERGAGLADLLAFWLKPRVQISGRVERHSSGRVFDGLGIEEIGID